METLRAALCALALGSIVASAAQAAGTGDGRSGKDIPLAELTAQVGPLRLNGASGRQSLSLPLSARETLKGATLHLLATNSISLQAQRSELLVLLNDHVLAQLPLSPSQPEVSADIRLPVERFVPGYNRLTFAVAQHATSQCEDPGAPELWTEIDTLKSSLRMDTVLKPLTPTLADLDTLIDPTLWGGRRLDIVTPGKARIDADALQLGGLLAQGAALRMAYVPLPLRQVFARPAHNGRGVTPGLDLAPLAGADFILAGTRDQLRPFIDPAVAARIHGGFLAVYPVDNDASHFMIVVSGRTAGEVDAAARTFVARSLPFPHQAEMTVSGDVRAGAAADSHSGVLQVGSHTRFDALGVANTEMAGEFPPDIELPLELPPDLYAPETAKITLDLNYAVGARMRDDSVINILLNGKLQQAIALDDPHGGMIEHYLVQIPLQNFLPGHNVVTFSPRMHPMSYGSCQSGQSGNLRLTLFGNSTVVLPAASHYVRLPDLALFAKTAFPYAPHVGGGDVGIVLGGTDSDTVGAAWTLLGKLAQQGHRPLWNAYLTTGAPAAGRDLLFVGTSATLPSALRSGAPWLYAGVDRSASVARLDGQLLMMQYRSPLSSGYSLTVVTASTAADLWQGSAALVEPGGWGQLAGDVSVFDLATRALSTQRLGPDYTVGKINRFDQIGYVFSQRPWLFAGLSLAAVLILTLLTIKLLRRFRRRYHQDGTGR
ncbi:cellulose biosynthesis cyclic di-GMP-binding regulatory protein BcsB [Paludibacterium yongneupense]|uniref:cellulose biosynthesis cyclic di-GMP-binding regulatory protein BcsB n=1 Tax=Paludibacterium yongneupense TaxID=400061 RepID=UPI000688B456|nr:cellulose biosynthesis cyclic di-GMP-binding regulatory protein BcsB [Paludibacterium yongneupense]